jgi:molybdopterin synthase sulfur carrier subunit
VTVRLRLFARAREAAGTSTVELEAATVGDLLARARADYGEEFAAVLASSRVWINGDEPAEGDATTLQDGDEVAVLPPVSGGSL